MVTGHKCTFEKCFKGSRPTCAIVKQELAAKRSTKIANLSNWAPRLQWKPSGNGGLRAMHGKTIAEVRRDDLTGGGFYVLVNHSSIGGACKGTLAAMKQAEDYIFKKRPLKKALRSKQKASVETRRDCYYSGTLRDARANIHIRGSADPIGRMTHSQGILHDGKRKGIAYYEVRVKMNDGSIWAGRTKSKESPELILRRAT